MASLRGAAAPLISLLLLQAGSTDSAFAAGSAPQPNVCLRSCWSARSAGISSGNQPTRAIIHHTAGANDFNTNGLEDSKANVRAVQNLHMDGNGWSDIGYHFLTDKFGNTFEGRAGTMTNWVTGAHSYMANTNSVGFNFLGYFHSPYYNEAPPAMMNAVADIIAWYMPNGWDPNGNPGTITGEFSTSPGSLCGHNEVSATACPGENLVGRLGELRTLIQDRINGTGGTGVGTGLDRKRYGHTVGYNNDGRMQLFVVGSNGTLYSRWQGVLNSGPWYWESLGTPGVTLRGGVATSMNQDGRQQIFVVGTDGNVYSLWQGVLNAGPWNWEGHGNPGVAVQAGIASSPNADGRQSFFVVGTNGTLYSKWQTTANGGWSAWESHGNGGSPLRGNLDCGWNQDGRQQLYCTGTDGNVYARWQGVLNAGPWYWDAFGNPGVALTDGITASTNADGRQQFFATGTNGNVYSRWQTAVNAGWSAWELHGTSGVGLQARIAAGFNQSGTQQIYAIGTDGNLSSRWQGTVNAGPWYWEGHGSPGVALKAGAACGSNADGRQEMYAIGTDGNLYSKWQNAPNSGWSAWSLHGNAGVTLLGLGESPVPPPPPDIIVDNSSASFTMTGTWTLATSALDKYGADYRYKSTQAITAPAQWSYTAAQARNYQVYTWYSQGTNRSLTAPYEISRSGGTSTVSKSQQTGGGSWQSLGTFTMNAGANTVKLSCWTTTGYIVIADAVKIVAR